MVPKVTARRISFLTVSLVLIAVCIPFSMLAVPTALGYTLDTNLWGGIFASTVGWAIATVVGIGCFCLGSRIRTFFE